MNNFNGRADDIKLSTICVMLALIIVIPLGLFIWPDHPPPKVAATEYFACIDGKLHRLVPQSEVSGRILTQGKWELIEVRRTKAHISC